MLSCCACAHAATLSPPPQVCGRPPFEVEDEAQTAALIMYSDAVQFSSSKSPQWADFVRQALIKAPEHRPSASALLQHPW